MTLPRREICKSGKTCEIVNEVVPGSCAWECLKFEEVERMKLPQALEMAEALTLDNENAISTLGKDGDEVAELLFEEIKRLRRQGELINEFNLREYVDNNYWENPEDAIGEIRQFISKVKLKEIKA